MRGGVQLKRAQSAGLVVVGSTPFDEYGIGARDMFTYPHSVLSPWRSRSHPGAALALRRRPFHSPARKLDT